MCGLAGIYSNKPVAAELYDSLIHLQHRGQDAAGIITYKNRMHKSKGSGLVRDIFTESNIGVKRPGSGISPMKWYKVLGKIAKKNFKEGELIKL